MACFVRAWVNWRTIASVMVLAQSAAVVLAQPIGVGNAAAIGPQSLEQLLSLAMLTHPSVVGKRAELSAAYADVEAARYQYYPSPTVQLRQGRGEGATVLALQQPLWTGGRLDSALSAANARADAAAATINEVQTALALRVTTAWQGWRQAKGRTVVLESGIELLTGYAQSVARRIDAGAAGESDRALVDARMTQSRGDLAAASAAQRTALSQLSQLVGVRLHAQDLVDSGSAALQQQGTGPDLDTLIAQALKVAPALRRAQAEVEAAGHEITQKRAARWPTLNLRAEHQRGNGGAASLYPNETRLLLVLDYTPGAGLSAGAAADAASARLVGLRANQDAIERELLERVTTEFEEYQSSLARQNDMHRTLKANADVLASYERLFIAGRRGWLDVLNAARELTQVQAALADVQALSQASSTRLRIYSGVLLVSPQ